MKFLDEFLKNLRSYVVKSQIPAGSRVCDVGCGRRAQFLHDISPHIAYGIGIDRRVEAKKEGNIETVKAYFEEHLQISNESIDVVTMMAVLEHVEDQHALLKECLRVLRPGGKILVTVPNYINKFIGEFLAFRLKIISEEAYRDHKRYYSKKELKQDLEQAGFIIRILKNWELGTNVFAEAYKEK